MMCDVFREGAAHVHVRLYELAKENETKPAEAGGMIRRRNHVQQSGIHLECVIRTLLLHWKVHMSAPI